MSEIENNNEKLGNQELELRLKHKQQPKLLHVLNIFLLKQGEYNDKSK